MYLGGNRRWVSLHYWRRVQRTTGSQDVLYVTTGKKALSGL